MYKELRESKGMAKVGSQNVGFFSCVTDVCQKSGVWKIPVTQGKATLFLIENPKHVFLFMENVP